MWFPIYTFVECIKVIANLHNLYCTYFDLASYFYYMFVFYCININQRFSIYQLLFCCEARIGIAEKTYKCVCSSFVSFFCILIAKKTPVHKPRYQSM